MLGWFRRLPGSRAINSNKLCGELLNVCQALAEYTNYREHYCCSSSQDMHISVPPPTPYSLTFTVSSIPQTIFTIFHINLMRMIDATSAIKSSWLLLVVNIMTTVSFLNQVQANTCRPRKTSPELCSPCGGQKHESSHTEPTTDQGPKTTVVKTDENKIPEMKEVSLMKKKQVKITRRDVG